MFDFCCGYWVWGVGGDCGVVLCVVIVGFGGVVVVL